MRFLACLFLCCSAFGTEVDVYFSPNGGCTDAIIKEIKKAKVKVLVQAYSFTSPIIAKALADASSRGVDVQVIVDKSQKSEKYSSVDFLVNAGIKTFIDSKHAIAHNKIIILDSKVIITGSFNFTSSAEERNAENLLVIKDKKLANEYETNWLVHLGHSSIGLPKQP